MKTKQIKKIEVLLILVALPILIIILNLNKVVLEYPDNYLKTTDVKPEFLFSSNLEAYRIVVDDDADFSSPVVNEVITQKKFTPELGLSFGRYYWKVIGFKGDKAYSSKVSSFEVVSLVSTSVTYQTIRNTGNTKISVKETLSKEGGYSVVGFSVLEVGGFVKRNETQSEVIAQQI